MRFRGKVEKTITSGDLEPFVFYDGSGKRWNRFRRGVQTGGFFLTVAVVLFLFSVLTSPQLPTIKLPAVEHLPNFGEVRSIIRGETETENIPFELQKQARKIQYVRSASPMLHPRLAARTGDGRPVVFGFYVNWDPSSIVSLRLNLHHLTHLVPQWLVLKNEKGDLEDESDPTVIRIASDAKLPILAMVTNFRNGWQREELHRILHNPEARSNLIDNIYSNLVEHKFAGVNIDLEEVTHRDRGLFTGFMRELAAKLKRSGLILTESVPLDDASYDLKRLSDLNDYLVAMVYDEHYQSGSPGPVASQKWFQQQLNYLAEMMPPAKTIVGFGNYGYDWIIGSRGSAEVGFGDVISAAVSNNTPIEWDTPTGNPVLRYQRGSQRHEVWFLDAVTALNEVRAASTAGFIGLGLWRLGAEDPGLWTVLKREAWPNENYDPGQLSRLVAQKTVKQYGDGDILRIVETPRDGKRQIWRARDGNFSEKYEQYPSYYVIESYGRTPEKTIALTFDDGPDATYTPQILDVLKAQKVPAMFFVVGVNAERYPDLVRRIYAEGHGIGNHTYSHMNTATISAKRIELELNATQRIIQGTIGVSTTLFRPPYNADSEPQTPKEVVPIYHAQQLGYITVGERIDPRDWETGATADGILAEVISEKENGRIILLHDGGGDRSQTVKALPKIIDYFRSRGYRFVALAELIGKTRDEVMPPVPKGEVPYARIAGSAFSAKGQFNRVIAILFLFAIGLTLFRSVVYSSLALLQARKSRRLKFRSDYKPQVSVLIAAYNEENVIVETVQAILGNGYRDLEMIIVDDGSTDRTLELLQRAFGQEPRVRIYTQPNGGKSAALNQAIRHASNEILITVDADTVLCRGTIEKLVRHFADPQIGAVSGNVRVGNSGKWIGRFQSIEYIYGFNLDRRCLDVLNGITVVPGAAGAWRKGLIEKVGGFRRDTLAEDTELTLSVRKLGCRIQYDEEAVAYTEVPEDTKSLVRQRFRWSFGTLQAAWKHKDAMFKLKSGWFGWFALPSIWLFHVVLTGISPVAELNMAFALYLGNWRGVTFYYLAFFMIEFSTGLLAYRLERQRPFEMALFFFQRIYFRYLMHYVLLKSMVYAVKGRLIGWDKVERRARSREPMLPWPSSPEPEPVNLNSLKPS